MEKWVDIILYSVILAILVNIVSAILYEFLGTDFKKNIIKIKKSIVKFIKNETYPISITLKTDGLKKYGLTQKNLFNKLEELLKNKEVSYLKSRDSLISTIKKRGITITCEFLPYSELEKRRKIKNL